jgi:hypothetical protein
MLATGRASMIPANNPAMMLPMVRPRLSSGASDDANGTTTCAPAEQNPTATDATRKSAADDESATPTSAAAAQSTVVRISRRFSIRSASETISSSPAP